MRASTSGQPSANQYPAEYRWALAEEKVRIYVSSDPQERVRLLRKFQSLVAYIRGHKNFFTGLVMLCQKGREGYKDELILNFFKVDGEIRLSNEGSLLKFLTASLECPDPDNTYPDPLEVTRALFPHDRYTGYGNYILGRVELYCTALRERQRRDAQNPYRLSAQSGISGGSDDDESMTEADGSTAAFSCS